MEYTNVVFHFAVPTLQFLNAYILRLSFKNSDIFPGIYYCLEVSRAVGIS